MVLKLRKVRAGSVPALKKKCEEIYSEGHFCVNCGSFMDEEVRYWGEYGILNKQIMGRTSAFI